MKRKVLRISLIVIVALLLIPAIALSVELFTKTLPATITVVAPPGLSVYSDPGCTAEVTALAFGDVTVGGSNSVVHVYVKNNGTQPFTTVTATTDFSPGFATFASSTTGFLDLGGTAPMDLTFTAVAATTGGEQSISIFFECSF